MAKKVVKAQAEVAPVAPAPEAPKVQLDPAAIERAKWLRRLKRWAGKADLAAPGLSKELMQEVLAG